MDRTSYRYNLEYRAEVQSQLLTAAKRFLAGKTNLIEAARELCPFQDVPEPELSTHLRVFVAIDSETDALPVGDMLLWWHPDTVHEQYRKIAEAERLWKDAGLEAAKHLVHLLETPQT
jgi:hypothetical protein